MKPAAIAKATVPVVLGVLIAGLIMNAMSDVELIDNAKTGYGG